MMQRTLTIQTPVEPTYPFAIVLTAADRFGNATVVELMTAAHAALMVGDADVIAIEYFATYATARRCWWNHVGVDNTAALDSTI